MSETQAEQRSVAEIIGWSGGCDMARVGHNWCGADYYGPTVDDMLAWLRGRGWHVIAEGWTDDGDIQFTAFHNETGDAVEGTDPTLRTALEVAVRAVDEQIQP